MCQKVPQYESPVEKFLLVGNLSTNIDLENMNTMTQNVFEWNDKTGIVTMCLPVVIL